MLKLFLPNFWVINIQKQKQKKKKVLRRILGHQHSKFKKKKGTIHELSLHRLLHDIATLGFLCCLQQSSEILGYCRDGNKNVEKKLTIRKQRRRRKNIGKTNTQFFLFKFSIDKTRIHSLPKIFKLHVTQHGIWTFFKKSLNI